MNKKEQIINEVWSAITHGLGLGLGIWAFVLLILKGVRAHDTATFMALLVYGLAMLSLYLFSTLFHCFYFTPAKRVFQIFDHTSIYLMIAGTYTPYCVLAIKGWFGYGLLVVVWLLALFGIGYHILAANRKQAVETVTYVFMGWMCVLGLKEMYQTLGLVGVLFLFLGGVVYTLGALIYSIKGVKYAHVWWHILVILGSGLMFLSVYWYL
ncbi:hemolysin III [Ligilactobacillus sp. WC1T17]|uniref:Hemolysin III n=1 Tax=Ligilactobacillus ruminis TaxID=1623 RepID=A0ABY1ADY8_9LACO|nr:hemolysin III [Ligilactobacillus ruminis]